jgi:hypothetical protein
MKMIGCSARLNAYGALVEGALVEGIAGALVSVSPPDGVEVFWLQPETRTVKASPDNVSNRNNFLFIV